MKQNYSDLLKDPRWQKKRLQILERDKFTCRSCYDNESTLHVHHLIYDSDLKPWKYNDEDLITLCEVCHKAVTYLDRMLANADFGFETISLVVKLLNRVEEEQIEKASKANIEKASRANEVANRPGFLDV